MRNLICLLFIVTVASGCALNPERINPHINTYRKESKKGYELNLNIPYKEAFEMVTDTFKENAAVLLKEDYENKVILASRDKYPVLMMNTYAVFFEEIENNKTKLIIKGSAPTWALWKIREEARSRKQLNDE